MSRGTVESNREKLAKTPVTTVLLQKDREIAQAFQAEATPTAVLIEADGKIGSAVAVGGDAIKGLVARAINSGLVNIKVKSGESAPSFTLPDIRGEMVASSRFRGKPSVLLFWNPSCGFCQSMLPELKAWEARRTQHDPEIVLVSTGSVEANQGYGLKNTILLDDSATVMQLFNANGTPTGVLLDKDGRVMSDVAVGSVAVLELASSLRPGRKRVPATANGPVA